MKFLRRRNTLCFVFVCYCGLMLWLLFVRARGITVTDYWAQVARRINLVPFASMGSMLHNLRENPRWDVFWVVVYNLGGNIAMFLPLGYFLPALWQRQRQFFPSMATVAGIMSAVELTQLLTLRGFCETDDLILNLAGAAIGWGFWRVTEKA